MSEFIVEPSADLREISATYHSVMRGEAQARQLQKKLDLAVLLLEAARVGVKDIVGNGLFPPTDAAALHAAAVISYSPDDPTSLTQRFNKMQMLTNEIRSRRGEFALWISSVSKDERTLGTGNAFMKMKRTIGLGIIDPELPISVTEDGDLIAPIRHGHLISSIAMKFDPESPLKDLHISPYRKYEPTEVMNMSETDGGVMNFILIAGNTAVTGAIETAQPLTRTALSAIQANI